MMLYKTVIKFSLYTFFVLNLISCQESKSVLEKSNNISITSIGHEIIIGLNYVNNKSCITLLNYDSLQIKFVDIEKKKILNRINLDRVFNVQTLKNIAPYQFLVHNQDSVFIGLSENRIFLVNSWGELSKIWDLNLLYGGEVELVFLPSLKMYFDNNILYLGNASNDYVGNKEGRINYFRHVSPALSLNVKNSKITKIPIKFPPIYQKGDDYKSYHISQCLSDNALIYSFGLDNAIYIYEDTSIIREVDIKSKYWKTPTIFPDDSAKNYYFMKKYNRAETRYDRIVYDNFRSIYYRLVNLSTPFERGDGTIRDGNNWSVILLNSDFEILDEIYFSFDDYFSYYFFPVPEGVLVGDSKKSLENKGHICLTLFKVHLND